MAMIWCICGDSLPAVRCGPHPSPLAALSSRDLITETPPHVRCQPLNSMSVKAARSEYGKDAVLRAMTGARQRTKTVKLCHTSLLRRRVREMA